jgi:predicted PurR-regulated permease PerM
MISSTKTTGRVWGIVLATMFAPTITAILHNLRPELPIALTFLTFVCLWIGFYFTGIWMLVERPAELDRKFPISSKEAAQEKEGILRLGGLTRTTLDRPSALYHLPLILFHTDSSAPSNY